MQEIVQTRNTMVVFYINHHDDTKAQVMLNWANKVWAGAYLLALRAAYPLGQYNQTVNVLSHCKLMPMKWQITRR